MYLWEMVYYKVSLLQTKFTLGRAKNKCARQVNLAVEGALYIVQRRARKGGNKAYRICDDRQVRWVWCLNGTSKLTPRSSSKRKLGGGVVYYALPYPTHTITLPGQPASCLWMNERLGVVHIQTIPPNSRNLHMVFLQHDTMLFRCILSVGRLRFHSKRWLWGGWVALLSGEQYL